MQKKHFRKIVWLNRHALNLLELMVAMAIFGMITYLVVISTVANRPASAIASATIFLNAQARQAVTNVRRDLLEAKAPVLLEDPIGTNLYRSIRFKIPLVDSNGALITTSGGDVAYGADSSQSNYIRYCLNGTRLERRITDYLGVPTGSVKTIAQNVTGFNTTYNTAVSQYEISLSFSVDNYEGTPLHSPVTFNTTVAMTPRN
jgi:type II secretory pathway pseudopilin PulG